MLITNCWQLLFTICWCCIWDYFLTYCCVKCLILFLVGLVLFRATEERAQRAEEQATHLDLELTQALESVRTLEQEAARLRELAESPSQPSSGSQLLSMVKQETSREDRRAAKQKSPKGKKK